MRVDVEREVLIEVIFDPACPWCYVGKRRLDQALALRPFLLPRVRWWPFLLYPDQSETPQSRVPELIRLYGSEARARRARDTLIGAGRGAEIEFALDRIKVRPNSLYPHRVIRLAEAEQCASDMVEALFYGHFIEGLDIGSVDVLVKIAEQLGLDGTKVREHLSGADDIAEVQHEHARARKLGVNGVPSFVFNHVMAISGAQEPQVLARMLDVAVTFDATNPAYT